MRLRAPQDFWAGVMFLAFAAVTIGAALTHRLGTAGRMGPGYFPLLLGIVLAGLGLALVARSVVIDGDPLPRIALPTLLLMALAVCVFGVAVEPLGLAVSILIVVAITTYAGRQFHLMETLALAAFLIAFSAGVFVYALRLPVGLWPNL